jgi:hypothetical protein
MSTSSGWRIAKGTSRAMVSSDRAVQRWHELQTRVVDAVSDRLGSRRSYRARQCRLLVRQ